MTHAPRSAEGGIVATEPGPALFACEDIHIRLGGRVILDGISLGIRPGEILGVVGPNGAGKTTLFEILSGRYQPNRGRVILDGRDVTSLKLFARARLGLGRTYQSPVVPDALTVGEVFRAARQALPTLSDPISRRMGGREGWAARTDVSLRRRP